MSQTADISRYLTDRYRQPSGASFVDAGATYFGLVTQSMRAYLTVENALRTMHVEDAAIHYVLAARK